MTNTTIPAGTVTAIVEAVLAALETTGAVLGTEQPAPRKAGKAKGKAKGKKAQGVPFKQLQLRLREHKTAGTIKPGITVREAIAAGLMTEAGILPDGSPVPSVDEAPKASKKAKKAKKARKAVVAEVVAEQPAKRTRPAAADMPRNALGQTTPKSEWAMRERLALTGDYDRYEIDNMVAAAHEADLI